MIREEAAAKGPSQRSTVPDPKHVNPSHYSKCRLHTGLCTSIDNNKLSKLPPFSPFRKLYPTIYIQPFLWTEVRVLLNDLLAFCTKENNPYGRIKPK